MNFLTQFWPQLGVLALFFAFLVKDLLKYKSNSVKASAGLEMLRYFLELVVVIASGFLYWGFFSVVYVVVAVVSVILAFILLRFSNHFEMVKVADPKMRATLASKVRIWDFATVLLLYFAGFFDTIIEFLW